MGKRLPVVEIIWQDCQFVVGGWEPYDDIMRTRDVPVQRSVGYVLADDKKGIMLAESLSRNGNVFGVVMILTAQIIKRRKLR